MNMEISEVFVLHTDSISTEPVATRVGIAGILPNRPRVVPNVKHFRVPTFTELLESIFERLERLWFFWPQNKHDHHFFPTRCFTKSKNLTVS